MNSKFNLDKLDLMKLEKDYQEYCQKFSPAYLSGSAWYVGPSIRDHIRNTKINNNLLGFLFYMSYRLD